MVRRRPFLKFLRVIAHRDRRLRRARRARRSPSSSPRLSPNPFDDEWSYDTETINGQPILRQATTQAADQRQGYCVHHASTVCIELRYRIWALKRSRNIPELSVQDVIDGARTLQVHKVLRWLVYMGVTTEAICPFIGPRQSFHMYNNACPHYSIQSYVLYDPAVVSVANSTLLMQLKSNGPFLILFEVSRAYLSSLDHATMVYEGCESPRNFVNNHLVVVVGTGCLGGVDYWLYVNNWGPDWGRKGKGMIAKHAVKMAYVPTIRDLDEEMMKPLG